MFTTNPYYFTNESDYRREELRRAWGSHSRRNRKRAVKPTTPGAGRVALAR